MNEYLQRLSKIIERVSDVPIYIICTIPSELVVFSISSVVVTTSVLLIVCCT